MMNPEPIARIHTTTCTEAAEKGDLSLLKMLREKNAPWSAKTFAAASRIGSIECLDWLHQNGCPHDETACEFASNLKTLQWLRAHQIPWNAQVTLTLSTNGRVDMLKWAMANGCPVHQNIADLTVHLGAIKFLQEKGHRPNKSTLRWAVVANNFETVRYLREMGIGWEDTAILDAISQGNLRMLIYMHQEGAVLSAECFLRAQSKKEILAYLINNRCPGYPNYI